MLSNTTTVEQLGAMAGQSIDLHVSINDDVAADSGLVMKPSPPEPEQEEYAETIMHTGQKSMPGAVIVPVRIGETKQYKLMQLSLMPTGQHMKEILVTIQQPTLKKPFLGGYRNKETAVEYHHASTQTLPKKMLPTGVSCRNSIGLI